MSAPASGVDEAVRAAAAGVRLVVFDVDGVLTDGTILLGPQGDESRAFSTRDGYGIVLLLSAGIEVAALSGRSASVVEHRMRELGVHHVIQGCGDKAQGLQTLLARVGVPADACAYMGDDMPDLPPMLMAGLAAAPADAHHAVRRYAHWVSAAPGGRGAARELAELVLDAQQRWQPVLDGLIGVGPGP